MPNGELFDWMRSVNERLDKLNYEVGKLHGAQKTTTQLIKLVILPLIIILAGLIGIKIF